MKKQQVVVIHGGSAYTTYDEFLENLKEEDIDLDSLRSEQKGWKDFLPQKLGSGFDVFFPEMPNWANAKYVEWKIWFEKIASLLDGPVILVGHSLGAIFLAQYFAEEAFSKKAKAIFLIAPPFKTSKSKDPIGDFVLPDDLSKIQEQCPEIFIYHSKDDPTVDFENAGKYVAALPKAHLTVFEDRGHFRQTEFPELVQKIKELSK